MTRPELLRIDKARMRRSFERSAGSYDAVAVLQREVAERLLERLDLIRVMPRTVLDLGCGTGQVTRALIKRYRGARVIALDIAEPMLHKAGGAARWWRQPLLVCGDAETSPLADGCIDLICSSLTLHWCNDLDRMLGEMRRVLAPGGLMMITTLGPDTLKELRASWAAADDRVHVNRFIDMHDLGDSMLRAGFADAVVDMEMMRLTYADISRLMQDLKLLGAHNSTCGRPRGLTGRGLLNRVRATYEGFRTREGLLPASFEVIYGHAWAHPERAPMRHSTTAKIEVRIPLERLRRPR